MSPELALAVFFIALVICGATLIGFQRARDRAARRRRDSHEDWHV